MRPSEDLVFPESQEEFYRRRDDRTNRCVTTREYQFARCTVTIDSPAIKTPTGQTILVVACNLLSRWCRKVDVVLSTPDLDAVYLRGGKLEDAVLRQMRDADPFGLFSWTDRRSSADALRLHIGSDPIASGPTVTVINASGWISSLGQPFCSTLCQTNDSNIVGSVAAACLGAAQVFKRAIGTPPELLIEDGLFDFFHLERLSTTDAGRALPRVRGFDLGRILLVGGGSVGSSLAYCLRLADVRSAISVIDKDFVKVENFNRSPLFGKSNFGLPKADAVRNALLDTPLTVATFPIPWNEFIVGHSEKARECDVWLPLANEDNVRASIQNNVPPLLIYAATNPNWGASHGRWIPGRDDCLIDRFPAPPADALLQCSTGGVDSPQGRIDAALPFLSMLAGLTVFADLLRLQVSGYPQVPNYCCFDFGGRVESIQKWDMRPRENCSCRTLSPGLYKILNRQTKYFGLAFPERTW